jgi:hypothetical protein
VTDSRLSRAHVGLAVASALVVLLASGVAIFRMGDNDERPSVTATGRAPSGSAPAGAGGTRRGPATDASRTSAGAEAAGTAGAEAAGAADALATDQAVEPPLGTTGQGTSSTPAAATDAASPSGDGTSGSAPSSGDSQGTGSPAGGTGGGSPDGGQGGPEAPPQPSQDRPEDKALVAASASAGHGAEGGVVALAITGTTPEADVTVGTSQVIGDHPPAQGTGVNFGGRLLQPPPTVASFPG